MDDTCVRTGDVDDDRARTDAVVGTRALPGNTGARTVRAQMQSSVPERARVIHTGARTHDVRKWVFVRMHPFTHG
jgi:hypothetical protein